ncbi:MAG: RNA methyltransferase [Bacteroidales bacterium]|nr:RNA methyltransferase [Bacteroidales bacterium]
MKDRKLLNSELGRISKDEYRSAEPSGVEVILDNVRSAHNVGSVFRSADAFRIDRVWLCGITPLPPTAEIHKTALGAEDSVRWEHRDDSVALVKELQAQGYTVVSVEQTEHSVSLRDFKCDFGKKYAFVFGNEVDGVSQEVVDAGDVSLEIPQFGTKHSLNVSVCAGVVLWAITDKLF